MSDSPIKIWEDWLTWLVSHDGRLQRRRQGGNETDSDLIALLPIPPGRVILTVGDLRALVDSYRKMEASLP